MHTIIGKAIVLAAAIGSVAIAAEILPAKALPLSTILETLEKGGLTGITDVDYDDGVWEVEGFRGTNAVEAHVDPLTGKVLYEKPEHITSRLPSNAKPASAIAKQLEAAGYAPIMEMDWEVNVWEIEAINAQGRRKLHVAPDTGKVLSDRLDD